MVVAYACLRFVDIRKNYYWPIRLIKYKRKDETHIEPQTCDDFDPKHKYKVVWCTCDSNTCTNNCDYYKAFIVCLGESEDDVKQKYENNPNRWCIPTRKLDLDTSSESETVCNKPTKSKSKLAQAVEENMTKKTLEKYKAKKFLQAREKIVTTPTHSEALSEIDIDSNNFPPELPRLSNVATQLFPDNTQVANRSFENFNQEDEELQSLLRTGNDDDIPDPDLHQPPNQNDLPRMTPAETAGEKLKLRALKKYKPKLYRSLVRGEDALNYVIEDKYKQLQRYDEVDQKIYLGLNVSVGKETWETVKTKKPDIYLREVANIIWKRKKLANRCLDPTKISKSIPGRSPVKPCTPHKVNLFLSLYKDYLANNFGHYSACKRKAAIQKSTETLSIFIRDCRMKEIQKRNRLHEQ